MAKLVGILLIALILEAVGVVLLSQGLRQIGEIQEYSLGEIARIFGRGFTNSYILVGMVFETVFFVGLLVLLKNWDVSLIWPLTSLGFVLTTLAAQYIRHEDVSALRWGGVLLIMVGASLVGWSERTKEREVVKPAIASSSRGASER